MVDTIADMQIQTLNKNEKRYVQDLMARMQSMDEAVSSIKLLLYGESGVGKTVAAMLFAQKITPLDKIIVFVDSEEGWVSLNNFPALKRRTQRITLKSATQMEDIAKAINERAGIFANVGTVVIDEHTSIADVDLLGVAYTRSLTDSEKDPDQPTQPDMGVTTNRIFKYTSQLILPGCNLILVAHQRVDKDNLGKTKTGPSYMPALSNRIRRMMHVVGYMTADEVSKDGKVTYNRKIQVQPTVKIVAKTRVGGLPVYVTANELIKACQEWLEGARPTQKEDVLYKDEPTEVTKDTPADEVTDTATDTLTEEGITT